MVVKYWGLLLHLVEADAGRGSWMQKSYRETYCPSCACCRARRVPYRWYERLLAVILLEPYRCCYCGSRFFRFRVDPANRSALDQSSPVRK